MSNPFLPSHSNWYGYCYNNNYEPITNYFQDLCIAEHFGGEKSIDRVLREVMRYIDVNGGYKAFTELCIILNSRCWDFWHIEGQDSKLGKYYSDLYYEYKDKFYEKYGDNEEACDYFFEMTD